MLKFHSLKNVTGFMAREAQHDPKVDYIWSDHIPQNVKIQFSRNCG